MEQFSLEKYLENPNREIVTRDGRPVRILDYNLKGDKHICIAVDDEIQESITTVDEDGHCLRDKTGWHESNFDLFFADEEEKLQSIEIPFGAKDSEFVRDEYYIPKGCEARIEGNKVIIEKIQKDELTEFEKELQIIISEASHWTSDDGSISTYCQFGDKEIKKISVQILDLTRKELQPEFDKEMDKMLVGMNKMKEEMMKDAVDGEYWDGSIYLDNRPTEYKDGDEVKIIIVKTEQQ